MSSLLGYDGDVCADMSDRGSDTQNNQEWTGGRGTLTAVSQQKGGWVLGGAEQDYTLQLLQPAPRSFMSSTCRIGSQL